MDRLAESMGCAECDEWEDATTDYDRATEYRRGYEDGARSLDAERAAVAARLREIVWQEGSHANLGMIGNAIMPSTGHPWTPDECERLRDAIITLMGGAYLREVPGYRDKGGQ